MSLSPDKFGFEHQKARSDFVRLFNVALLIQTIGDIAFESKDDKELFQLTINALCIFTSAASGTVFLRDTHNQNIFLRNSIYYEKNPNTFDKFCKQKEYTASDKLITDMVTSLVSFMDECDEEKIQRILIPLIGKKEILGFFELVLSQKTIEPDEHLIQVLNHVGYQIGSVLYASISSEKIKSMQKDMISLTSHQLKTPIGGIRFLAETLKDMNIGKDEKEFIKNIEEYAINMNDLVTDLLNLSKIEQGNIKFNMMQSNFESSVDSVVRDMKSLAKKKGVFVEIKKGNKPLSEINTDSKYLQEALKNIISNAIKYTKDSVVASFEQKENKILFSCRDNGIGIPEEDKSNIFNKFYRASNAKSSAIEGTGLGLSITQKIIEKLGGKIWFESEKDKGTTFYIELPVG